MGIPSTNHITITALGVDTPNTVEKFTQSIANCGGNILNTRMTTLGNDFAILLLVEGSWGTIAKIESLLKIIESKLNVITCCKRTTTRELKYKAMTYVVHVVTIDRVGILNDLSQFFSEEGINIEDITAHTYQANNGTRMVAITVNINISVDIHIPSLREKFMSYCDALNLDAGMEPLRD